MSRLTLNELLEFLREQGVVLRAQGNRLGIDAPRGVLREEVTEALRFHKQELLQRLHQNVIEGRPNTGLPLLQVAPEDRYKPFPLTDMQQAYWVGRHAGLELGAAIHVFVELECHDFDVTRFEQAWDTLVQRHDMLRAIVHADGMQQILREVPAFKLSRESLVGQPDLDIATRLATIREEFSEQVLPLDTWPLFDVCAVELTGVTRVFLNIDCTLIDSWSVQVLFRELVATYNQSTTPLEPAKFELSFRDYVLAVKRSEGTALYERSLNYWRARLPSLAEAPQLPMASGPAPQSAGAFRRWEHRVSPEHWQQLSARGVMVGVTPTSVLLTAFAEVLGAWSKDPRFTINVPLANRQPLHPEVNRVLGTFSSFTLLEVDCTERSSFAQRAQALHSQMIQDLDHSQASGVRLLRELNQESGRISTRTFPVVFTSFASGLDGMDSFWIDHLGEALGQVVHSVTQTPQVLLDHQVLYQNGGLYLNWDAAVQLFEDGVLDDMFAAYIRLLDRLATDEAAWQDPNFLVAASPQALVQPHIEQPFEAPSHLLHTPFLNHVKAQPDRAAVISLERTLTYAELGAHADYMAKRLLELNLEPGAPVAVVMCKGWEQAVACLAASFAGHPFVPIDATLPPQRLQMLLAIVGTGAALVQEGGVQTGWPEGLTRLVVEKGFTTSAPLFDQPRYQQSAPDDPACIIFTSGSTGTPAGVVLTHRGLMNSVEATNLRFALTNTDRAISLAPAYHDLSLYDLFGMLTAGGAVVYPNADQRRDPSHWLKLMETASVTVWNSVPAMMEMLLVHVAEQTNLFPDQLRLVFLGGDWVPLDHAQRLRAHLPQIQVVSTGGPTETTLWNIWYPIGEIDAQWKSIPYGSPIPNARYYVMDAAMRERPVWAVGELCCAGVGLARGYHNNAERTAEKFVVHPITGERLYRTGDLGRRLPDGNIEFLGRIDFQLSVMGRRIEPGEIESTLLQHPGVTRAIVVATGERNNKTLVAYVIPAESAVMSTEASRETYGKTLAVHLQRQLPDYLVPKRIIAVEQFPLTGNGKIDRAALSMQAHSAAAPPEQLSKVESGGAIHLEGTVADVIREVLGIERVPIHSNFFELGATSLHLVRIHAALRDQLDVEFSITNLFQHPTVAFLSAHLDGDEATTLVQSQINPTTQDTSKGETAVAIVGMAGRFPGAADLEQFWQNLVDGVESVTHFSEETLRAAGVSSETLSDPDYVRVGAILDDIDAFDAEFFGFSTREAEQTDPQQRLFLECAWQALENAGYRPDDPSVRTGVFAGKSVSNYIYPVLDLSDPIGYFQKLFGNDKDYIATQTSYKLDLKGPSISAQTACSTSLVTLKMACDSILAGDCDLALAGGVAVKVPHSAGYLGIAGAGMLSKQGQTRPFDADSDGIVPGNGVGIVVLKRLDRALAEGDMIRAVIRGAALNNDGGDKVGFTAPSINGQIDVISRALAASGVSPESVSYVEAHGTGTNMGDPIEIEALRQVFCSGGQQAGQRCGVGSVKSNIGHLDSAAGVAGIIKTVLSLEHQYLPASLNFSRPNPNINFADSPFYVVESGRPWHSDGPRRAGVSSFGVGGTNAHVILEEAPASAADTSREDSFALVPLSARNDAALRDQARHLKAHLQEHPNQSLSDLAYTAQVGRKHFANRIAIVADDTDSLQATLDDFLSGRPSPKLHRGSVDAERSPRVAFLFTGHGSQYLGMGKVLYERHQGFREHIERCDAIFERELGTSILEILFPTEEEAKAQEEEASTKLVHNQSALFVIQTGLAALWRSFGIEPVAVMGHSIGEYAAAHVAGALDLEDAIRLVIARTQLIEQHGLVGATAVVSCAPTILAPLLAESGGAVTIASHNSPESLVISGEPSAMRSLCQALIEQGVPVRELNEPRAAHSPLMDPVLAPFEEASRGITAKSPRIPVISNLTGECAPADAFSPAYWREHLRQPVRLADGFLSLEKLGCNVFLEIGPKPSLIWLGQQCLPESSATWAHSLRKGRDDWAQILENLGVLHVHGMSVSWEEVHRGHDRKRSALPTYAFQRQRYWSNETIASLLASAKGNTEGKAADELVHPLLGTPLHAPTHTPGSWHFQGELRLDTVGWLADHAVFGQPILPASAFVEIALAIAERAINGNVAIRDLLFREALLLSSEQPQLLHSVLEPEDDNWSLRIYSAPQAAANDQVEWTLHAQAYIELCPLPRCANSRPSAPLLGSSMTGAEHVRLASERGAVFGPCFQSIEELWQSDEGGVARIVPATALKGQQSGYIIHPAILDACLQVVNLVFPDTAAGAFWLPTAIDSFQRLGAMSGPLQSEVTLVQSSDSSINVDVEVFDAEGDLVVVITGLHLMQTNKKALFPGAALISPLLHRRDWHELEVAPALTREAFATKNWIVISGNPHTSQLAMAVRTALGRGGAECVLISDSELSKLTTLVAPMPSKPLCIVYLSPAESESIGGDALPQQASDLAERLFHCTRALIDASCQCSLALVTCGAQGPTQGDELSGLAQSPLLGLSRVAGEEHPELGLRCIDLDPDANISDQALALLEWTQGEHESVALRGDSAWGPYLHRAQVPNSADETRFAADATYLITGGLGRIGLLTAQWMVARGAHNLVLLSRRVDRPNAMKAVEELRSQGTTIECVAGDVTDAALLEALIEKAALGGVPLRGVIHAAGLVDDGLVQNQSWSRIASVIAPKLSGAWALHEATAKLNLDFFVLFSSSVAILGGAGQCGYAAGNVFLGALAAHRRASGLPALCIDWGPWSGAATAGSQEQAYRLAQAGVEPIEPAIALVALGRLLSSNESQVAVFASSRSFGTIEQRAEVDGGTPGDLICARIIAATTRERPLLLADHVSQTVCVLLGISVEELGDRSFQEAGLDSLGALELRNQLQSSLGCRLSATLAFQYPSALRLGTHLVEHVVPQQVDTAESPAVDAGMLDGRSADELAHLLESRLRGDIK